MSNNDIKKWVLEHKKQKEIYLKHKPNMAKLLSKNRLTTLKNEVNNIIQIDENLDYEIELQQKKIFKEINKIRKDVKEIIEKLTKLDYNDSNLYALKQNCIKAESQIAKFKESQKEIYNSLYEEEETITNYLGNVLQKYDNINDNNISGKLENFLKINDELENKTKSKTEIELDRVNKLLYDNGGINCGWDNKDHNIFLTIHNKYKNNYNKLISNIELEFPLLSKEEIQLHIEMHNIREDLLSKRKELLAKYKLEKKEKILSKNKIDGDINLETNNNIENNNLKKYQYTKNERELNKLKLEKWKREKDIDRFVAQMKEEDGVEKINKTKKLTKEEELKKLKLEEFKERKRYEKLKKEELEKQKNNYNIGINKATITNIKQREQNMLDKKLTLIEEKKNKNNNNIDDIKEKLKEKYNYVDSRLNNETNSIAQKQTEKYDYKNKNKFNDKAGFLGGNIVRMTGKAVPTWMK